jgi:hypothetical protein
MVSSSPSVGEYVLHYENIIDILELRGPGFVSEDWILDIGGHGCGIRVRIT